MEKEQNDEVEIDLLEIFALLKEKIVKIVGAGVILATLVAIGTLFIIKPQYESTSKLYIVGESNSIMSLTSLQAGSQLAQDYIHIVESRPVIEKVISNLNLDMEYDDLLDIITLNNPSDTRILEVTAKTDDPYVAKEIVDEIGKVSADRIKNIMGVDPPTTVEYGHVADEKSSPSLVKNTAVGLVGGMLVSAFIIIVIYLLNNTISSEDDVEKYLGLNNLGVIPIEEGSVEQMMRDKRKRKRGQQKQKAGVKHG